MSLGAILFLSLISSIQGACPPYPTLLNGQTVWEPEIPGDTPANTYLDASCIPGYVLTGQTPMVCGRDNVWYGCAPYCNAPCPVPTPVLNAANTFTVAPVNGYVEHGTGMDILCNVPYRQVGDSQFTCTDGVFTGGIVPTCIEACDDNIPLLDGSYTYSDTQAGISPAQHLDRSTLAVSCNSGYTLEGPNTLTCVEGFWVGGLATCYAPCATPQPIPNGQITFSTAAVLANAYFTHGTTATSSCTGNYRIQGASQLLCYDGIWQGSFPNCLAPCGTLASLSNGVVSYSNGVGTGGTYVDSTTATFTCNGDYSLKGCGISTCVDGSWTNSVPQCFAPCADVVITTNAAVKYTATVNNKHPHESKVIPSCGSFVSVSVTDRMLCNNGKWIGALPTCLAACPPLSNVDYRNVSYSTFMSANAYGDGTVAYFSCYSYAVYDTPSTLTCNDGVWEGSTQCKASCMDIEPFPHTVDWVYYESFTGVPAHTHAHGSTVRLICENDYHLVGPQLNTCNNGHWDNKLQWCRGPPGPFWWWPWLVGFLGSLIVGGITCSFVTKALLHQERLDHKYNKLRPLWFW